MSDVTFRDNVLFGAHAHEYGPWVRTGRWSGGDMERRYCTVYGCRDPGEQRYMLDETDTQRLEKALHRLYEADQTISTLRSDLGRERMERERVRAQNQTLTAQLEATRAEVRRLQTSVTFKVCTCPQPHWGPCNGLPISECHA